MKSELKYLIALSVSILFIFGMFVDNIRLNYQLRSLKNQLEQIDTTFSQKVDTTYITLYDTIKVKQPKYVEKEVICYDTIWSIQTDQPEPVQIPIEQKKYIGQDYKAYVSGYKASLDSISIFRKTEQIFVDREVTKTIYKPKRWSIGVGVSSGYDIPNKKISFGPTVGIYYNLYSF